MCIANNLPEIEEEADALDGNLNIYEAPPIEENRIRPELLLDQEFVVDYSYLFLALPGTSLSPARVEKPR
ncbi:hypothetical protein NQ315_011277 [Exocentrus adspersus]|uniref:Uncharacterized protein n=1 Tax=Exocentrus adspersus TaxID=1586481 RepID=A0AAV8VJH0_9CUCU|nr:hypothetical protein NQ315_011277 [Exocentrus adspersus]